MPKHSATPIGTRPTRSRLSRRALCLGLPALALGACGSASHKPAPAAIPPDPRSMALLPPRFSDADPVDFPAPHPRDFPVHGIDAARFQNAIDWHLARADGVNFAWLKATEGGDRTDPMFRDHWQAAGRAGVPRGAYHFYYFCTPAEDQARWFIRNVPREPGSLPPVLDLEWNPFSPTCTWRPERAHVQAEARRFLDILQAHYGQRPVVYSTPDFWQQNRVGDLGTEVWLRSTADHARDRYGRHDWHFWQYSGTGRVRGVGPHVDLNVYNGSAPAFRRWLTARSIR